MSDTVEIEQPLTYANTDQFIERLVGDRSASELWTTDEIRQVLSRELPRALAPTRAMRQELKAAGVAKNTIDALCPSALQQMVKQIDERAPGTGGYVTQRDEVIAILSELSKLVPASVLVQGHARGGYLEEEEGLISLEIAIGFALEREEL